MITPYGNGYDKSFQVEQMFDRIAPSYDALNHSMSLGIDRRWRRQAIKQLLRAVYSAEHILDIATGTGDFAIETARELRPVSLTATDISLGMMSIAREKVEREGLQNVISFRRENCRALSFDDETFDAATVAFGIRNFQYLDASLKEICRVLRKGGCLSIVELSRPTGFPMRQLFGIYAHTILPLCGRLFPHDTCAYRYLASSIEAFPQAERMADILKKAGFESVSFRRLTFGICTCFLAIK